MSFLPPQPKPKKRVTVSFDKTTLSRVSQALPDIRSVLEANSVKAIQDAEDRRYITMIDELTLPEPMPGDTADASGLGSDAHAVTVLRRDGDSYVVKTPAGNEQTYPSWVLTTIICKNCRRGRSAHTEQGKCIYEPTYWEAK